MYFLDSPQIYSVSFISVSNIKERTGMDNIEEVVETILIGFLVTKFLQNTGRALSAIELCKECLMLLPKNTAQCKEYPFIVFYRALYLVMFLAYYVIPDYTNAARYGRELLVMFHDSGDTDNEGKLSVILANICKKQNRFVEEKELHERAIDIKKANGDRAGEALAYEGLGAVFHLLGKYHKAKENFEKALLIRKEISDRKGEAECYSALGTVFNMLGKHRKASELFQKAHHIRMEIGGKEGEAADYENKANLFSSLGDHQKAKECLEKELAILLEIGDREGEVRVDNRLGYMFGALGEYAKAEEYFEKARLISSNIGDDVIEYQSLLGLTWVTFSQSKEQEGNSYLLQCIQGFENLRNFNNDNDQLKISLLEKSGPYTFLCILLSSTGNPQGALYVEELGRARALADLMAAQYSVENQMSADLQSWSWIQNVIKNEKNCTCLYISYLNRDVFHWVIETSRDIHFRREILNENTLRAELVVDLDGLFNKSFHTFGILPRENCEDRSLDDTVSISLHNESRAPLRGSETKDTEGQLHLCYKLIIAPVADLLTDPEIIIVPDRSLYRVPFAALRDESGEKYLSESFRIRIVPSFTTLRLIQDSPADYHSHTGALIVGDPKVGQVLYKGSPKNFNNDPLPCARKEAEMIGRLLGVRPLLGERATKQSVLQAIKSVSLIHFAAHGNAERGEIALSPNRTTDGIPQEEDYLLTMADISKVQLRAKLVVLSCCHSGRGKTKKEGVIGIARAFLGSGARSVLVALWALDDTATEQLMSRFYEHLVVGESASESLHEAMKWMRSNGFTKVSEWAPFMLIGDNVTFDFTHEGTFIPEKVFSYN